MTQPGPDPAPRRQPGGPLEVWMAALAEQLGLDVTDVDLAALLDVARDVAHGIARPAAPLSLYLVGYAAATRGSSPEAIAQACATTSALAREWVAPGTEADGA